jgi:hypothetical protein
VCLRRWALSGLFACAALWFCFYGVGLLLIWVPELGLLSVCLRRWPFLALLSVY